MDNELKDVSGIEFTGCFPFLSGFELILMLWGVLGIFDLDSEVFND